MKPIVLTNNSLIHDKIADKGFFSEIIYDGNLTYRDVLKASAGMLRKGHKLLMNPFYGNIPPSEMPYKTVVVSETPSVIDLYSLRLIDAALRQIDDIFKGQVNTSWGKDDLECLKKSDLVIVERWLVKVYIPKTRINMGLPFGKE